MLLINYSGVSIISTVKISKNLNIETVENLNHQVSSKEHHQNEFPVFDQSSSNLIGLILHSGLGWIFQTLEFLNFKEMLTPKKTSELT